MSKVSLRILPGRTATRSGRPSLTRRASGNRTGTIYIAVLGVALIVGLIGATAIHVARIELHKAVTADEIARARLAAQSGIEYAISLMNTSDNATIFANTLYELSDKESFSFTFIDSNDALAEEEEDSVKLRSVGTAGKTTSVVEVLLQPAAGLDCLTSSLHANGTISVTASPSQPLRTDRQISANDDINIMGIVEGDAASTGNIVGQATKKLLLESSLEMPDPNEVFEYYKTYGTWISVSSLGGMITQVVLSPASNPYGGITNEQGIYVVDCQGASIILKDCRIVGTLVLLNAGSGTVIRNSIILEPAVSATANFTVLMVQGSLEMNWNYTSYLREDTLNTNFNPVGTPIDGSDDNIIQGTWPSRLKGLVYVTENLRVQSLPAKVEGVVITGGTVDVASLLMLNYDSRYFNNPPPGFASGSKMKIVPSTWQRVKSATP